MSNYRFTISIRQDQDLYIYIYNSALGLQFLIYCYILDSGSYLENKDNHQTHHNKNGTFQGKREPLIYFG